MRLLEKLQALPQDLRPPLCAVSVCPPTVLSLGLGAKPLGIPQKAQFWLFLVGRPEGTTLLALASL